MPTWKAEFQMAARTGNDVTIASFTMIDSQWMPMTFGDTKPESMGGAKGRGELRRRDHLGNRSRCSGRRLAGAI